MPAPQEWRLGRFTRTLPCLQNCGCIHKLRATHQHVKDRLSKSSLFSSAAEMSVVSSQYCLPRPKYGIQLRSSVPVHACSFWPPSRLSSIRVSGIDGNSVYSSGNVHARLRICSPYRRPLEKATVSCVTCVEKKHAEIEAETNDTCPKFGEFDETWKQTVAFFKEQAVKLQSVSQEAYVVYSQKAAIVLEETASQMKILADKAGHDLSLIAKEVTEDGKEYMSAAAEFSPETVKDVVETFTSSVTDLRQISKVYDFYLGIPYGLILSLGGFFAFMLTGSISAVRFGVILGGALLALSVSSLRSWKKGESFDLALKGQAAISAIIFLRELRLLLEAPSFLPYLTSLISGAMVAFYAYRIVLAWDHPKECDQKNEREK